MEDGTSPQMAITRETSGPGRSERLLIADMGQDRVIVLTPATDNARFLNIALNDARAIATYRAAVSGKPLAYVGEPTRVVRVPVLRTVDVVPWIADDAGISDSEAREQIQNARAIFEECGFDVYIADDKINHFSAASLLDLEITDWSQATYDTAPNFMQRFAAEANRVPDNNQCQNINSDQTIFRADP